jgi:hypothetical protein
MSIKLQLEIKELRSKVETLERKMNRLNQDPRMVGGTPDIVEKPEPKKKLKSKG